MTSEREQIARVIDPDGWATFDRQTAELKRLGREDTETGPLMYVERSLSKADQIIAMRGEEYDRGHKAALLEVAHRAVEVPTLEAARRLMEAEAERDSLRAQLAEKDRQIVAYQSECREVEQVLGAALGYPWFKDDQKNFPGSTEADGVCVGEHAPSTIAQEIVTRLADKTAECVSICADKLAGLTELRAQLTEVRAHRDRLVEAVKPFAEVSEPMDGQSAAQEVVCRDGIRRAVTDADFRRARSALDAVEGNLK